MKGASTFHAWLELARVSNLPTVWTNVMAAWLITGGGWDDARLFWLVLGGSLLYTAGMILNDAADVVYDKAHRAERPIPSGRIELRWAWRVGLILLVCGAGMMIGRGGADTGVTLALAALILAYDCYHKPWVGSVLLMGGCRSLLYLAAASPLADSSATVWGGQALIPGLVLGGYIVGLSLAARAEAGGGKGAGWVPVLLLLAPVLATLFAARETGGVVAVLVGIGLLLWVSGAVRLMKRSPPMSIGPAVGRLLAGIVWVDAAAVAASHPRVALVFVLAVPLLMLWQRRIAAT